MGLQSYQALMTVNWYLSKRGERDGLYPSLSADTQCVYEGQDFSVTPPLSADTQYVHEGQDFSFTDFIDTLISNFQPSQL